MATSTKVQDAVVDDSTSLAYDIEQMVKFKPGKSSTSVFESGDYTPLDKKVETASSSESAPPKPLYIVYPEEKGVYPVLLFLHGFFLRSSDYSSLLKHVVSHGFIAVAPQLYYITTPCSEEDIQGAADVANWLFSGLKSLLPQGVEGDLVNLILAGHSRGGNAAFSLALGYADTIAKFSLLLAIDPVAGSSFYQIPPQILNKPGSFDLDIPVLVVGTGLGGRCAPKEVNHIKFFDKCNSPRCHMVITEYGHLDLLDEGSSAIQKCLCKKGNGAKYLMRKSITGIIVAFSRAYIQGNDKELKAIIEGMENPPAKSVMTYYKN